MTDADRRFLEEMVPHRRDGTEMARLALRRAEHDDLREMAQRMIDDSLRETDELSEWHRTLYGTEAPARGAGMSTEMQALARAVPFDRAFIRTMIPHHEAEIGMARQALDRAEHREVRELAGRIAERQEREIETMRAWCRLWYGAEVSAAGPAEGGRPRPTSSPR